MVKKKQPSLEQDLKAFREDMNTIYKREFKGDKQQGYPGLYAAIDIAEGRKPKAEVNKSPQRKKASGERGGSKLNKLLITLGPLALATAIALGVNEKIDNNTENNFDKIEQEATSEVDSALNSVVVLKEGVRVRTSPAVVNNEPEEGPDTNAFRVSDGDVLVVDRPVTYQSHQGTQGEDVWLGFTMSEDAGKDNQEMYWVNYTDLQQQSDTEHEYVSVYDFADTSQTPRLEVANLADNGFTAVSGEKGGSVAVASTMSQEAFNPQYIQSLGLTPRN